MKRFPQRLFYVVGNTLEKQQTEFTVSAKEIKLWTLILIIMIYIYIYVKGMSTVFKTCKCLKWQTLHGQCQNKLKISS